MYLTFRPLLQAFCSDRKGLTSKKNLATCFSFSCFQISPVEGDCLQSTRSLTEGLSLLGVLVSKEPGDCGLSSCVIQISWLPRLFSSVVTFPMTAGLFPNFQGLQKVSTLTLKCGHQHVTLSFKFLSSNWTNCDLQKRVKTKLIDQINY